MLYMVPPSYTPILSYFSVCQCMSSIQYVVCSGDSPPLAADTGGLCRSLPLTQGMASHDGWYRCLGAPGRAGRGMDGLPWGSRGTRNAHGGLYTPDSLERGDVRIMSDLFESCFLFN